MFDTALQCCENLDTVSSLGLVSRRWCRCCSWPRLHFMSGFIKIMVDRFHTTPNYTILHQKQYAYAGILSSTPFHSIKHRHPRRPHRHTALEDSFRPFSARPATQLRACPPHHTRVSPILDPATRCAHRRSISFTVVTIG